MPNSPGYQDIGTTQTSSTTSSVGDGVPYWGTQPDAYDTVVIAGLPLPGLCSVKGEGFEMRHEKKRPPGKHGATVKFIANEPTKFSIHVLMTEEAHLRTFERLVPLFKPTAKPTAATKKTTKHSNTFNYAFAGIAPIALPGNTQTPNYSLVPGETVGGPDAAPADPSQPGYLSVQHPLLKLFRITHCRIMKVGIPEQKEDKGMWEVTIWCEEHVLEGARAANTGTPGPVKKITGATAYDPRTGRINPAAIPPSQNNTGPR